MGDFQLLLSWNGSIWAGRLSWHELCPHFSLCWSQVRLVKILEWMKSGQEEHQELGIPGWFPSDWSELLRLFLLFVCCIVKHLLELGGNVSQPWLSLPLFEGLVASIVDSFLVSCKQSPIYSSTSTEEAADGRTKVLAHWQRTTTKKRLLLHFCCLSNWKV